VEDSTDAKRRNSGSAADYGKGLVVATGCTAVAFLIRLWLAPLLGTEMPYLLFIPAAFIAAWWGGLVAGACALVAGILLADHFFVSSNPAERSVQMIRVLVYFFTLGVCVGLMEVMRRARRRSDKTAAALEREVRRRIESEQILRDSEERLQLLTADLEKQVAQRTEKLSSTIHNLHAILYQIAHTFRGPARAIEAFVTMAIEDGDKDATSFRVPVDHANRILKSARRLDRLILDLLEFGHLTHTDPPLGRVWLRQVVDGASGAVAEEIKISGARVEIRGELPAVLGNADLLERVVAKLLTNALTFCSSGKCPTITISAQKRVESAKLWVEDDGPGIDPRFHETIFALFESLGPTERAIGTGTGLAFVRQAVTVMGGRAGVESRVGFGSRFWIELKPWDAVPDDLENDRHSVKSSVVQETPCAAGGRLVR
jgi:signal transduction histidine kinase